MNDWKAQLRPDWSPINIGILVVCAFVSLWLLALMLAYILYGRQLGLDLGRPETFKVVWRRMVATWKSVQIKDDR